MWWRCPVLDGIRVHFHYFGKFVLISTFAAELTIKGFWLEKRLFFPFAMVVQVAIGLAHAVVTFVD